MRIENDIPFLTDEEINRAFYLYKYDGRGLDISTADGIVKVDFKVTIPILTQEKYDKRGHIIRLDVNVPSKGSTTVPLYLNGIRNEPSVDAFVLSTVKELFKSA